MFPQSVPSLRHSRLSHNGQSPSSLYSQSAASSRIQIPLRASSRERHARGLLPEKSNPPPHHGGGVALREEARVQNIFAPWAQCDTAHLCSPTWEHAWGGQGGFGRVVPWLSLCSHFELVGGLHDQYGQTTQNSAWNLESAP